jgi:hypothetical protein
VSLLRFISAICVILVTSNSQVSHSSCDTRGSTEEQFIG